ncbi:MAG: hypothetical protein AAB834_04230, partial [Patescibacteria group bacterium]
MNSLTPRIKASILIATVTVLLDWIFHKTLTNPMETFDYFTVKWLLAFFVATIFTNLSSIVAYGLRFKVLLPTAAIFSILMSMYYRWWEYFSNVPFSVRAPNIVFLERTNVVLFAGTWFIGHALFFIVGALLARRFFKPSG